MIDTSDRTTTDAKEQIQAVSKFFGQLFFKENTPNIPDIQPVKMNTPFTATDVETEVKKLKNN